MTVVRWNKNKFINLKKTVLDTQINVPTLKFNNSPKMLSQQIRKRFYKTLWTSVINCPLPLSSVKGWGFCGGGGGNKYLLGLWSVNGHLIETMCTNIQGRWDRTLENKIIFLQSLRVTLHTVGSSINFEDNFVSLVLSTFNA